LFGKREGKRPPENIRVYENYIKMDPKEIGWENVSSG
jgi:hypothetical protein